MDLEPKFLVRRQEFNKAWKGLTEWREHRDDEPHGEDVRYHVIKIESLKLFLKCAKLLHLIWTLLERGLIDKQHLYFFYYDEITEHPTGALTKLWDFCNLRDELEANYTQNDLIRLATSTRKLLILMNQLHEEHGGEPYTHQLPAIDKILQELKAPINEEPWGED